jgi:PAS domain S-box-containing protein
MDSVVFWVFSASTARFEYVNRAFEKIWGKKREDLLADPKLWAASIHPDDRGAVNSCLEQLMTGLKDAYSAEFRVIRPDGSVRWVRGQAVRLALSKDGRVLVAGAAEDITERKTSDASRSAGEELQQGPDSVKRLTGLLPICAYCKKIRDDKGSWESLEKFIRERSGAEFTHCICPDCAERFAKKDIGMA